MTDSQGSYSGIRLSIKGKHLPEIETAMFEVIAQGQAVILKEADVATALLSASEDSAVTEWAAAVSLILGMKWYRLQTSGELVFQPAKE